MEILSERCEKNEMCNCYRMQGEYQENKRENRKRSSVI